MSINTKQSTPELAHLAASTMNNPKASKTAKQLAASVLAQAMPEKQTGVKLQTLASRVMQSSSYSIVTKSLAASVLAQSTKDR